MSRVRGRGDNVGGDADCPLPRRSGLVEEAMQPGMGVSFVARRAGITPSQLFAWKRRMLEGGQVAVEGDEDVVGASQMRVLEKRVRELERLLGRKTMENEILKEALSLARPKKTDIAARLVESAQGRFPMKAVAETLGGMRCCQATALRSCFAA